MDTETADGESSTGSWDSRLAPQQLLLIDFDDLGPMIKPLDLPMVADRAGDRPGSTFPANRSQWAIMLSRCCLTLGVVASAWSLRARAAAVR